MDSIPKLQHPQYYFIARADPTVLILGRLGSPALR